MHLRKIVTNDTAVLDKAPEDVRAKEALDISSDIKGKVLGVRWDVKADAFYFTLDLNKVKETKVVCRCSMLSIVSDIYDPLGLISSLVISGKLLFQAATRAGLSWDEPLHVYQTPTY